MNNHTLLKYLVTLLEESSETVTHFECEAEDEEHAFEQALNAYPQCTVIECIQIEGDLPGLSWLRSIKPGDKVWWSDPDEGKSSGFYVVDTVNTESGKVEYSDTLIQIRNEAGSVAEVIGIELHFKEPQAPTTKSISDDDLCASCRHCDYRPGDTSHCYLKWPGKADDDGVSSFSVQ